MDIAWIFKAIKEILIFNYYINYFWFLFYYPLMITEETSRKKKIINKSVRTSHFLNYNVFTQNVSSNNIYI